MHTVDEFGCDLSTKYSIPNYQFDCTTSIRPTCNTNNNLNVYSLICGGS